MNITYKKLLPANIQDTKWGQLVDAYQNIIDNDLKPDEIDVIRNKDIIEYMSSTEIQTFAKTLGYTILTVEGYTATLDYLQKQLLTIVPRILYKTAQKSYLYTSYVFNLNGNVYPLWRRDDGNLEWADQWWSFDERAVIIENLDSGDDHLLYKRAIVLDTGLLTTDTTIEMDSYKLVLSTPAETGLPNTTLDAGDLTNLDQVEYVNRIVRYILFHFKHLFCENETEFQSTYTIKALKYDILNNKRTTEVIIYEPKIVINYYSDGSVYTTQYTDYLKEDTGQQQSILINTSSSIDLCTYFRFGTGGHTTVDGTIIDVQTFSYQLDMNTNIESITEVGQNYTIRKILSDYMVTTQFSEVAGFDTNDNIVLYSKFPKVYMPGDMYTGLCLEFNSE